MPQSKSLRAIGQSLELLGIEAFELKKEGLSYIVRSESLPATAQPAFKRYLAVPVWDSGHLQPKAGHGSLRYDSVDISWLDARGRKRRRNRFFARLRGPAQLSHLLRTLGAHLDRIGVSAFNITWASDFVFVDYQVPGGQRERETFRIEKLRELSLRLRFRRSRRARLRAVR